MSPLLLPLLLPAALAGQPSRRPPDVQVGRRLWKRSCWSCHGRKAEGDGPLAQALGITAPPLAGRVPVEDPAPWIAVILEGRGEMPAFAASVSPSDARRILTWLATLEGDSPDGGRP